MNHAGIINGWYQYSHIPSPYVNAGQVCGQKQGHTTSALYWPQAAAIPTHKMHARINYTDTCAQQASLVAAEQADTQWFNSLRQEQEAMEWNGSNNQLSMTQGVLKPAIPPICLVPSLMTPSHPDTIHTTLTYIQRSR